MDIYISFFFFASVMNFEFENLSLLSLSHIYRIVIILLILFITLMNYLIKKPLLNTFVFIYLGLIISSILQ